MFSQQKADIQKVADGARRREGGDGGRSQDTMAAGRWAQARRSMV